MEHNRKLWDEHYSEGSRIMWWPGEPEVRFFGRLKRRIELQGKKGLDVGFGVGRDLWLLYEIGIDPYRVEISEEAVKRAMEYSKKKFPTAKIILYDGKKLLFNDEFFDFVLSHGVLDHMFFDDTKLLIMEIHRVLKKNGYLFLMLHSIYDSEFGNVGKEVEKNTFIIENRDFEKGIQQHYFSYDEILELLEGRFEIENVYLHEEVSIDVFTGKKKYKSSFWVVYAIKK